MDEEEAWVTSATDMDQIHPVATPREGWLKVNLDSFSSCVWAALLFPPCAVNSLQTAACLCLHVWGCRWTIALLILRLQPHSRGFSSVSSQTDREGCQTYLLFFHFQFHDSINMFFFFFGLFLLLLSFLFIYFNKKWFSFLSFIFGKFTLEKLTLGTLMSLLPCFIFFRFKINDQ